MTMHERFADSFDHLHELASARTGLFDFGDELYHQPLRNILESIDFDHGPRLTPNSKAALSGMLVDVLCERLHTEHSWNVYPQYRQVVIKRPLIITGLPRTGSTALHRLMSLDEQFQGVPYWLYRSPMPRPPRHSWDSDPSYLASVDALAIARQIAPELFGAHDVAADELDECYYGLRQSFCDPSFGSAMALPSHADWFSRQDATFSYRRYADLLRLVGMNAPDRTWLLKNPSHMYSMEALFAVFPDACIIQTHRHPLPVIGSIASLIAASQRIIFGDFSKKRIGAAVTQRLHAMVTHGDRVRQQYPSHYFDMDQSDLIVDPMRTIRAIYGHFGLGLSSQTAARMAHWLEHQPAEQKSGHKYEPSDFGIDAEVIEEHFADYIARYHLSR